MPTGTEQERVAVTGADGQLGFELCRRLGETALPLYEHDLDITSRDAVLRLLTDARPTTVINAAAFTDVDRAEKEAELCYAVNVDGTSNLVEACESIGSRFVQISTDYVFFGSARRQQPFREDAQPNPQGVYAQSKLAAEQLVKRLPRYLIVRTSGLYVNRPETSVRNFAKTMLRLAEDRSVLRVVDDQHCTPSYVPHVAAAVRYLLETSREGTFHVVNSGCTTWFGFAVELFRMAGLATPVEPITTAEYAAAAPRPLYSVLDNSKYANLGGPVLPRWEQGIADFLARNGFGAKAGTNLTQT